MTSGQQLASTVEQDYGLRRRKRPTLPPGFEPPPARFFEKRWFWLAIATVVLLTVAAVMTFGGNDEAVGPEHTVVYSLSGTAPGVAVAYGTAGTDRLERQDGTPLPWTHTTTLHAIAVEATLTAALPASSAGSVTCSITIDGVVVATHSASGSSATASCTGYSSDAAS